MNCWRDLVSSLHFGVPPHDAPDWEHLKTVQDRMTRIEEDVETLRATIDAITWRQGVVRANHEHH